MCVNGKWSDLEWNTAFSVPVVLLLVPDKCAVLVQLHEHFLPRLTNQTLYNTTCTRKSINTHISLLRTTAAALILFQLDYCNSLLYGLQDIVVLQSVQNATARLITGMWCSDHITPVLRELHWLHIRERVKFKVACLVCRDLSIWQMIAASCLTVLGALYGQLTSRLARYHERTAAMATELLQLLDLVCGTLYWSNCTIQTSPTNCFDDSWSDTFLGAMDAALCDLWYVAP